MLEIILTPADLRPIAELGDKPGTEPREILLALWLMLAGKGALCRPLTVREGHIVAAGHMGTTLTAMLAQPGRAYAGRTMAGEDVIVVRQSLEAAAALSAGELIVDRIGAAALKRRIVARQRRPASPKKAG